MNAKSVLMSTSAEIQRLDTNILAAQTAANEADGKADKALFSISSHEQICALRYSAIDEKLKSLKSAIYICLIALAALMKSDKISELLRLMGFGA